MKRFVLSLLVTGSLLVAVACSDEFSTNTLPPSSDGGTDCKPTTASVQSTIFARRCTNIGCHAAKDPASSLDLESPGVDTRLNNVEAADCPGEVLVQAGKPDVSFLIRKLEDEKPTCGTRMPRTDKAMSGSEINCLKAWISSLPAGPPRDASAPDVAPNCSIGESPCGGACVDRQTDSNNCGGCGTVCPTDKKFCSSGECVAACPGGTTTCGSGCVDTARDTRHCGGCDKSCNSGQVCTAGACGCGEAVAYKAKIEDPIIVPLCATSNCHGRANAPAGGLDLRAGTAYGALVAKKSTAPTCNQRTFVVPSDVPASYLVDKLRGTSGICGSPMPKSGGMAPSQLAAIESWICNGAPND